MQKNYNNELIRNNNFFIYAFMIFLLNLYI